jgi:hypothetical protein
MDVDTYTRGDKTVMMQPMQTTTQVWPGWIGTMPANDTKYCLTWDEWRTYQHLQRWSARDAALSPSRSEGAARAFLAWFDAAASDPQTPQFDDRELAVRRFLSDFEAVASTLAQ